MKKPKILILIAVIVVLVAGIITGIVLHNNKKNSGNKNITPEVKEAQIETLRVLYSEYKPVIYRDGDNFAGFDAELIEYVCGKMGISFEFKQAGFDEMQQLLDNDEADCIWTGFVSTKDNREKFDFSQPYVTMDMDYGIVENWVVAVKKDRDDNLLKKLEEALKEAEKDGTIKKLAEKYELKIAQ